MFSSPAAMSGGRFEFLQLAKGQWTPMLLLSSLQVILFLAESWTATGFNSVALQIHAYHTFLEVLQSGSKVLSSAIQSRNSDSSFTYGWARVPVLVEYSGGALVGVLAIASCLDIVLRLHFFKAARVENLIGDAYLVHISGKITTPEMMVPFTIFAVMNAILVYLASRLWQRTAKYNTLPAGAFSDSHGSLVGCGPCRVEAKDTLYLVFSAMLVTTGGLMSLTGWDFVDAIGGLCGILLLAPGLYGIFSRTSPILLQKAPAGPRAAFDKGCREVSILDGVVQCCNEYFWIRSPGQYVATLTVKVRPQVDRREILGRIRSRFAGGVTDLTVQIEEEDSVQYYSNKTDGLAVDMQSRRSTYTGSSNAPSRDPSRSGSPDSRAPNTAMA